MFLPSQATTPLIEAALQAFCSAMNTPVVNIEELEVGPARAAIVLSSVDDAKLDLFVFVRSIDTGDSVIFQFQGDPAELGTPGHAVEAAMSFAEGIGFIFDEELVEHGGEAGRERAWNIWQSLIAEEIAEVDAVGDELLADDERASDELMTDELSLTETVDESDPETDLTDLADLTAAAEADDDLAGGGAWVLEDEIALDEMIEESPVVADSEPSVAVAPPPTELPRPTLTKFRRTPELPLTESVGLANSDGDEERLDRALDEAVFDGIDAGESEPAPSAVSEVPATQGPPQSARLAQVALETESLGNELSDGTDFLTRVLSSF